MARVAVVGERLRIQGFALAGALVLVADDPAAVRAAWGSLGDDVALVVLTPAAAAALGDDRPTGAARRGRSGRDRLLVAVMPS